MAIAKNTAPLQSSISLEEGEVIEDGDSIASSREPSLKDEPLSSPKPVTTSNRPPTVAQLGQTHGGPPSATEVVRAGAVNSTVDIKMEVSEVNPAVSSGRISDINEADLERAKSLVLDLLGWGVPPEYLVDHGVSPQVIYKIFTDLNLRLPSNLILPQATLPKEQ